MIFKKFIKIAINIPRKVRYLFYKSWNRFIFYLYDINYGKNLQVYNNIYIKKHPTAKINIGDNFTFTSGESFNPLCRNIQGSIYTTKNAEIIIGDNVGISSACIWAKESIHIGNNVLIGGDTILLDTDAHNLDYKIRLLKEVDDDGYTIDNISACSKPIIIQDDVLIGTRCIILKGVTIGARSIIGSGSVVTRAIPSDCIAAGNPCKIIKRINQDEQNNYNYNSNI